MRRFLLLAFIFCSTLLVNVAFADEWDNFAEVDRMWDGQKSITNKQFEDTINALQEKQNKKEEKVKKKKAKKLTGGGQSLHNELNPNVGVLEVQQPKTKDKDEGLLLNIPVDIFIGNEILGKGFYKVIAERDKEDNKIYLMFYQSQFFKGKIVGIETNEDYEENEIDFVRILPYNENFMKIIFGSLDFNAYAYIPYIDD